MRPPLPLLFCAAPAQAAGPLEWAQAGLAWLQGAHQPQPSAATLALAAALVGLLPLALVVPMTLVCLAVAHLLPPAEAAAAILGGVAINTCLSWGLARTVFGARVEAWLERRGGGFAALRAGARRSPLKWAFLGRYVPAPFALAPMVLASAGVGLGATLLGSLLGMLPWTLAYIHFAPAGGEASLARLGRGALGLLLAFALAAWLRRRAQGAAAADGEPLRPRRGDRPLVRLYSLPGQALSLEARAELGALREELGFEVEELVLDGSEPEAASRYRDHAPVALLGAERLFNYKMDENVLRRRLGGQPRALAEET